MEAVLENEKTLDKTALRDFAVNARRKLKERIELQAKLMGFFEDNRTVQYEFEDDKSFKINGETFSKKQADVLRKQIQNKGYETVIDEVAYTWFNRFIALYYMEVNGYSESNCNIISNVTNLSQYAVSIASLLNDKEKQTIIECINNSKEEPILKTLLLHQCNIMNKKLPFLFEEIEDYTELLFPSGLLNADSVIKDMIALDKDNWQEVEIIGWLYQYYNQAEKDRVIQAKKRYKVNEIPYATQLFTPKWIVKYMTQNSLGRLWQEAHSSSKLRDSMEFYLEPRSLTDEDKQELEAHIMKSIMPENIKVYDPACGSGHILVYAYSLLYEMYKESGYIEDEIPSLILKNNLFGLDICKRASQLAQLAVLLRARKDDADIFNKYGELNICCIENSQEFTPEEIAFIADETLGESYNKVEELIECFKYANIYGSLSKYPNEEYDFYAQCLEKLVNKPSTSLFVNSNIIYNKLKPLVKQLKILQQQYECVITNPPYLGNVYMEPKLADFIQKEYKDVKSDLFSAFIDYCRSKAIVKGHLGFMTPMVWMFISSYEMLRSNLINNTNISSLVQLEYSGFDGATVPVCTFTLRNMYLKKLKGSFIKLTDFTGPKNQPIKTLEAVRNHDCGFYYKASSNDFHSIPGFPIAYWISEHIKDIFKNEKPLGQIASPKTGMTTGDNDRFLRLWQEVDFNKSELHCKNKEDAKKSQKKWFPYCKGGGFRRWYGYNEYFINWQNDGDEIRNNIKPNGLKAASVRNEALYFKQFITWSAVTSSTFSCRLNNDGALFDSGGSSINVPEHLYYLLAVLNSCVGQYFLNISNTTLNYQPGDIAKIPMVFKSVSLIEDLTTECIKISKNDWDSFETSWDFKQHPLLRFNNNGKLQDSFNTWKEYKQEQFNKLKANEEELNRLFIEIYGLQDEMAPEVADKDITVSLADEVRDIKSLLSYAVGCMLGRYSLDENGLAYAGGEFDSSKYTSLEVDEDGILPILADTWFDDDIIEELKRFLKVAFGEMYLTENLNYIASVLKPNSGDSAENIIRNYFLKDFYKDHLQIYKKRPIYWMFTSGKEKAFNCLMYLHRYDKTTLSRVRKDYLHEYQAKLDRARAQAEDEGNVKLNTLYTKYQTELVEYDRKLQVLADSQIELDLDDGVKVNYGKLSGLLEAEKDVVGKK